MSRELQLIPPMAANAKGRDFSVKLDLCAGSDKHRRTALSEMKGTLLVRQNVFSKNCVRACVCVCVIHVCTHAHTHICSICGINTSMDATLTNKFCSLQLFVIKESTKSKQCLMNR